MLRLLIISHNVSGFWCQCEWVPLVDHLHYDHMRQLWLVSGVLKYLQCHYSSAQASWTLQCWKRLLPDATVGKYFWDPLFHVCVQSGITKLNGSKVKLNNTRVNCGIHSLWSCSSLIFPLFICPVILDIWFVSGAVWRCVVVVNDWSKGGGVLALASQRSVTLFHFIECCTVWPWAKEFYVEGIIEDWEARAWLTKPYTVVWYRHHV